MLGAARLAQVPRATGGNADAAAYVAAAGITDSAWIAALETFFNDTTAIRAKLDALWIWANQSATAARTDLILPSRALLTLNSVTGYNPNIEDFVTVDPGFTQWRGYKNATPDGSNYTSLSLGLNYSAAKFNSSAATTGAFFAAYLNETSPQPIDNLLEASPSPGAVGIRLSSTQIFARIGSNGAEASRNVTDRFGLMAVSAVGATYRFSRNGDGFIDSTTGQNSTTGTPTTHLVRGPARCAAIMLGQALTDAETLALYTALQTLLTTKGAQV